MSSTMHLFISIHITHRFYVKTQLGENHVKLFLINLLATAYYRHQYVTMFSNTNIRRYQSHNVLKHQPKWDTNPLDELQLTSLAPPYHPWISIKAFCYFLLSVWTNFQILHQPSTLSLIHCIVSSIILFHCLCLELPLFYPRSSFEFITSKIHITCLKWPQTLSHIIILIQSKIHNSISLIPLLY